MKSLRGFTLLEVLMALAITAIIAPTLFIVLDQMIITPPDERVQLALTNEIGLLSSQLYVDGYAAKSFINGTNPYYGNFSWTNTSTDTNYLVSYYYNNSHIYRQVTINGTQTLNATVLTYHTANYSNFSLARTPNNNITGYYIQATISVSGNNSRGKPVTKNSTIYIAQRPSQ